MNADGTLRPRERFASIRVDRARVVPTVAGQVGGVSTGAGQVAAVSTGAGQVGAAGSVGPGAR